jgi:parallel beta-helix repeat protein
MGVSLRFRYKILVLLIIVGLYACQFSPGTIEVINCPTSCDDDNDCTIDLLDGSATDCSAACSHTPIVDPLPGDGCCPLGITHLEDSDCPDQPVDDDEICTDCPQVCSCLDSEYCFQGVCLLEVSGNTYYVAPDGSDNGPGTFEQPWESWQKAFDGVAPGDLVYFRDGVYYADDSQKMNDLAGTAEATIRFFNYPNEKPILDGALRTPDNVGIYTGGIIGKNVSNIHLKGLTVRNMPQLIEGAAPVGFSFDSGDNITIENCVAHDIGYRGFYFYAPGNMYIKNCDAYNCIDPLSDKPGNHGDGFIVWDQHDESANLESHVVFEGCRAWNNSDDGWDAETEGYIELHNCWAFNQGHSQFSRIYHQ